MKINPAFRSFRKKLLFRGFSIQQRLPLLICMLLLAIMVSFGAFSYFSVRSFSVHSGQERLQGLGEQLSTILRLQAQGLVRSGRQAAANPTIRKFLLSYSTPPDSAKLVLETLYRDSSTVLQEIRDNDFHVLLRTGKADRQTITAFHTRISSGIPDTGTVGSFHLVGDIAYYPTISGITDNSGRLAGYLVRWRQMRNSPEATNRLSSLMGSRAKLFLGNIDNSVWTNLVEVVPRPLPSGSEQTNNLYVYKTGNSRKVAAIRPVAQTPWQVMVEFPEQVMMEAATRFLNWVILIGTGLLVLGFIIAWVLSRNITVPLDQLTTSATNIANNRHHDPAASMDRNDELGKLARAFNAMVAKLRKANNSLEQKVAETAEMNMQLRDLSAHLQNIREEERKHIAREMHDELGQFLTGLKMDIGWLKRKIKGDGGNDIAAEKLAEMAATVDEAVLFVRKLAAELRPSILDDLGLIAALEWHSQEFSRRFSIPVEFHAQVAELAAPPLVATGLFRMYQESLTNVARHAGANKVYANLMVSNRVIHLTIQDDGRGFDKNGTSARKTLGLLGMKERAAMIGGKLEIISRTGEGTTILIHVPQQGIPASPA